MSGLSLIVVLLTIAVMAVVLFRLMHLPPILGYLSVGVLIGPHAFALLPSSETATHLAEFGIVFLMFSIGLEFSLPKLNRMRRVVLGLGGAQVALTMLACVLLGLAINPLLPSGLHLSAPSWLALGGALAMSSTAIVLKILTEKLELDAPHGRTIFGMLLFQDLAIVPLLIAIPALARDDGNMWVLLGMGLLKAAVILTVLLSLGQKPMHAWLTLVARRRSQELFMLNLLLMTLGFALLTEAAGLSLALGAFIAGMLISETEFKLQVEEDILPFKDILLGFFFVTMGMQLNFPLIYHEWPWVLGTLVFLLLIKLLIIAALTRAFGQTAGNAIRTALALAPAGEFGLVLLTLTVQHELLPDAVAQWVLAAMLMSMFMTPFILQYSDKIVYRLASSEWLLQSLQLTHIASHSIETHNHIIIAGFGRSGTDLARLLREQNLTYIGIDNDPERVQKGGQHGHDVVYGDITRTDTLIAAGIQRARAVVITHTNSRMALQILQHTKSIAPTVPVIVRTLDDAYLEQLQQAGAVAVVPEILEGSLVLASQTLLSAGVAAPDVLTFIARQRRTRYDLLRHHFEDIDEPEPSPLPTEHTDAVVLRDDSLWVNQTIDTLPLAAWRVSLHQVARGGEVLDLTGNPVIVEHDVLTFVGSPSDTLHAAQALNGEI
ncbi:MAG: cation:proton antiporter [Formosimonas sp.]